MEQLYVIIALFWSLGANGEVLSDTSYTRIPVSLEECLEQQRTWVPEAASVEPVAYGVKSQCVPVQPK